MNTLRQLFILITVSHITLHLYSQKIDGHVFDGNTGEALVGVNVYWLNTTIGVVTDVNGAFKIEKASDAHHTLVFSYVGYQNDTIAIEGKHHVHVNLSAYKELQETVIESRASGTFISRIEPTHKEIITTHELQRAACCNLSESFETNPSVDVSYSDAITGAKQIELLGLSGIYSQIQTENIPSVRGPAIPYGLLYVPGPWMESIHISKGTSTVINGYESITGQINVEYKKPEDTDRLFFNLYVNDLGKVESGLTSGHKINDKWSAMILAHVEYLDEPSDHNHNTFMDHPLVKKYNIMNRYRYDKPGSMESLFGFKILDEARTAGQIPHSETADDLYEVLINTQRYEAFAKTGFFFPSKPGTSLGTILSASHHNQESIFGRNKYDILHQNLYANIIYETQDISMMHKLNIGPSFQYDLYDENINGEESLTEEVVGGVFTQYTYNNQNNWTAIAGVRYDYHNLYGGLLTPRLHSKYDIAENLIWRASAGKGYRIAHVFAENTFLLMNSRNIFIADNLKPEEAWNYGTSLTYDFSIIGKESQISTEFYRTDFVNQVIIDMDKNPREIHIYNLDGLSYSNSFQFTFSTEPLRGLDLLAALRWTDVKTTTNNRLKDKPLVNRYKGLLTLSYLTQNNRWQFDFTSQFNGKSRLPDTSQLPEEFRQPDYSPSYTIINAQVTYKSKMLDIYLGGENMTSYTQKDPIISAHNPYGDYFDTSFIWGPLSPRMIYAGLRFAIN